MTINFAAQLMAEEIVRASRSNGSSNTDPKPAGKDFDKAVKPPKTLGWLDRKLEEVLDKCVPKGPF